MKNLLKGNTNLYGEAKEVFFELWFNIVCVNDLSLDALKEGKLQKELEDSDICPDGLVIDDHKKTERKIIGIFILNNGLIGCMTPSSYYSINALMYFDDINEYHLGTKSVGGLFKNTGNLEKDIEEYNKNSENSIVAYKMF